MIFKILENVNYSHRKMKKSDNKNNSFQKPRLDVFAGKYCGNGKTTFRCMPGKCDTIEKNHVIDK